MKNLIKVILASMLCFTLCGCNSKTTNSEKEKTNENEKVQNDLSGDLNVDLPIEEVFVTKFYCINLPQWSIYNRPHMKICNNQSSIISLVDSDEDSSDAKDSHEKAIKCYIDNIYMEANVKNVIVENDSIETINGIEMYKYEGYAEIELDKGTKESYVVGYSFELDGTACTVVGVALDNEQSEEELEKIIDASILTLKPFE